MDSGNISNNVYPSALAEPSDKTSESNGFSGFSGGVASTSDKGTSPKSTSASNRSETSLLYGSFLQNSENPTSPSNYAENHSNSAASHRFKTVACPFSAENDGFFPLHIACAG
jgi:hypothetical protein